MPSIGAPEPAGIGQRVRTIRKRRGLSLDVTAGLAGISKSYLSQLETGKRHFERRSLLENVVGALGVSVTDVTGQPYLPTDRGVADAMATIPGIRLALLFFGPDDIPDTYPRSLDELVRWAKDADGYRDQTLYSLAGKDIDSLLTELQAHALTTRKNERDRAVMGLVSVCSVAATIAYSAGNLDLALSACRRGYDFARRHNNPGLLGFARWQWSMQLMRLPARKRAQAVLTEGIDELTCAVNLAGSDTLAAEMVGIMHLQQAQIAARDRRTDDAETHLAEADKLARQTGERNAMGRHFGPTNVAVWRLDIGVELDEGGRAYEEAMRGELELNISSLASRERESSLQLDLARALVQHDQDRDDAAARHLNQADRIAPQRIRPDPIVRELATALAIRARRRVCELDSLRNRFGMR